MYSETSRVGDKDALVPTTDAVSDRCEMKNMVVNLPDDAFLSDRESKLLQTLNRKIDDLTFESCDICVEDGFNLSVVDVFFHVFAYLSSLNRVVLCFVKTWPVPIDAALLGEGSCHPCVDP